MMEEQELAEQCRRGNNKARQQLYEQYAAHLYGICLRYVSDRETAQDLLHDGFLQLFRSMDKFQWRGQGSLGAWMDRVMVNLLLQYLRREEHVDRVDYLEQLPDVTDEPEESLAEAVPAEVVMELVRQLPAGYRTVFNLYVVEGKSHKEIADMLGIREKSSASQLARAKSVLAQGIRRWMEEKETN